MIKMKVPMTPSMAPSQNHDFGAPKSWFWLGAMLGVIGTFILIIQPNKASAHDAKTNDATDPL